MSHGRIYLVPTVISPGTEKQVLSPQILEVIPKISLFLNENVRTSRRFISSLKLGLKIEDLRFEVLDKDTDITELHGLLSSLKSEDSVAIMSESGCPGIADPGSVAIELAHSMGLEVIPLVGPSSILLTLMGSGLNGQNFTFHGYLPIQERERAKALRDLERDSISRNQTQLFIETPYRNEQMFKTLLSTLRPTTRLCIGRELTGENQVIRTQEIKKWKSESISLHKLPTVFAIQG